MKKLITSIAALLLFAGISNATETNECHSKNALKSVETTNSADAASALIEARTISQIIEENSELRLRVEEMSHEADNLISMLEYSNMMHTTISHLNGEIMNEREADIKSQLDYAKMMNTTLLNLNAVVLTGK